MHGKWKEDVEHNGKFDNILTKMRERNRYVGRKVYNSNGGVESKNLS